MELSVAVSGRLRSKDLAQQIRAAILEGRLRRGSRLPSSRALAESLGVSRTLVSAVYEELVAEGYLEARRGSGTYVAADLPDLRPSAGQTSRPPAWTPRWQGEPPSRPSSRDVDFTLDRQVVEAVSARSWARMWRFLARQKPPVDLGPPEGDPELREAIADYLRRARGLRCGPEDVVVTSGAVRALELVARALVPLGEAVAVEEPGYPAARRVLQDRGARLVPVPVDEDGLRVDRLRAAGGVRLAYVTPSHQYPLGVRMSVSRRIALLEWAAWRDAVVVEDDYDSELRFDGPPLPALAGLDGSGRVVYVGTFSKVLAPGLRVGYAVAPRWLRERLVQLREASGDRAPWPVQRALAAFLASGDFDRHVRRVRRRYAERRAALREVLGSLDGLARLRGMEAGLHAFLELAPGLDEGELAKCARERGVWVSVLRPYYLGLPDRSGWLLAYGGLPADTVRHGASVLSEVLREAARGSRPVAAAARALR
jgi:GntR family transcriptional regulator/MocR family aminotransferase